MAAPTLIDLPPPPSNADTPSEMPGTPNSTTTSLSALSTTAIKDGHRGSALPNTGHHHHTPSTNTLEAERADRISRLAGLERVSTVRAPNQPGVNPGNTSNLGPNTTGPGQGQIPGYFDAAGNPVYTTKMSTVGSASATGSVGRTGTWASGSRNEEDEDTEGEDKMSMDTNYRDIDERDRYSTMDQSEDGDGDGMSDEGNASLVGFGEGAGSTVSGPIYTRNSQVGAASPAIGKSALASQFQTGGGSERASASPATTTTSSAFEQRREAKYTDGVADDTSSGFVDTTNRSPVPVRGAGGTEAAERILRDRLDEGESRKPPLGSPDEQGLGKFYFEDKK